MTFRVEHHERIPHVTGMVGGVVPVVTLIQAWTVEDDDVLACHVLALPEHDYASVFAERIAELLNRHGLSDTPDTIEGAA